MRMLLVISASTALLLAGIPGTMAQNKPSDPQIAHIAYTAGAIDIAAAKLALSKSSNQLVKDFAQSMLDDHQAVNEQAMELVEKLGVTPEDNPTSQSLTSAAEATRDELDDLEGNAFDRAYIENEVAFHAQVNEALKELLIPSAQNEELKSLLETGLKLFQGHQQHAEHVAAEL